MRPSAVVDGSSLLRNDVQFVAGERQQLKRIAALARTMLVPLHLSSSLLLLLLHRMKTLCGSARGHRGRLWEWEGTRSDAPMGAEGRWEHLLLPGTRSHPRYFYKKQCQQQTAKSEGTRLDASMEGRGCWYQAFISTRHILSPSRLSPPPNIFTKQAPEK